MAGEGSGQFGWTRWLVPCLLGATTAVLAVAAVVVIPRARDLGEEAPLGPKAPVVVKMEEEIGYPAGPPEPKLPLLDDYVIVPLPRPPVEDAVQPQPHWSAATSWDGYVQGLRRAGLDVVICFDSTGSMGPVILELRERIRDFIRVVTSLIPNARVGLVTYRDSRKYDRDDYEYTVKLLLLQTCDDEGLDRLQLFLNQTEAHGGGDIPEAVWLGLATAMNKVGWRPHARRVIIILGDAPPHAEDDGLAMTYKLCREWKDAGCALSCVDTTGASKLMDEFKQMAAEGGGEATPLTDAKDISKVVHEPFEDVKGEPAERALIRKLVVLTFGSKWKKDVDNVYDALLNDAGATAGGK